MQRIKLLKRLVFVVVMTGSLLFTGCSGANKPPVPPENTPAPENTVEAPPEKEEAAIKEEAEEPIAPEAVEEALAAPELIDTPFDLSLKDDQGNIYFECRGNNFLCSAAAKKSYAALAEELEVIDETKKAEYENSLSSFGEEAKAFYQEEASAGGDFTYYRWCETSLQYGGRRLVSLLRTENGYLGGAHPDFWYETINLDAKTGEELLLSDILTDQQALNQLLMQKLYAAYPEAEFLDLEETLGAYSPDAEPKESERTAYQFTLDPAGITFYFGPYALNSYAEGPQTVSIEFTELTDIMREGFVQEYFGPEMGEDFTGYAPENEREHANSLAIAAPGYTGLTSITAENHEDGTYVYEDMTEDGLTIVTNLCVPNESSGEQDPESYAKEFAAANVKPGAKVLEIMPDEALSSSLSYPVFRVSWEWGENEDFRQGTGVVILTDSYTFYFGYSCPADFYEENESFYGEELSRISWVEN